MRLCYTAEARGHIAAIYNYIRDRSTAAAIQVAARIRLAAEQLTEFPRMGRIGRVPDTHEWVVRGLPYIMVYEVGVTVPDEVVVLAVFHAAQNREDE